MEEQLVSLCELLPSPVPGLCRKSVVTSILASQSLQLASALFLHFDFETEPPETFADPLVPNSQFAFLLSGLSVSFCDRCLPSFLPTNDGARTG